MSDGMIQSWVSRRTAGVAAVAAAWTYIVLLCRLTFSKLVLAAPGGSEREQGCFFVLVLSASAGCFFAAAIYRAKTNFRGLTTYFRVCALSSLGASLLPMQNSAYVVAMVMGFGMGGMVVTLFTGLRSAVGRALLGWYIGVGVGLAHAACSSPWIAQAPALVQAVLACIVAIAGSLVSGKLQIKHTGLSNSSDYEPPIVRAWVLALIILTIMESACGSIINNVEWLVVPGWQHGLVLWTPMLVHLVVAPLSGRMLDKGSRVSLLLGAFGLLAFAGIGLRFVEVLGSVCRIAYSAGASMLWVCLVYYAARGGRRWQVAAVFSISGWLASAVGINAASGLQGLSIPAVFLMAVVLASVLGWRWYKVGRFRRAATLVLALAVSKFLLPAPGAAEYQWPSGTFSTQARSQTPPVSKHAS